MICENCKFANWDFSLFPQDAYRRYGCIVIPEQFDLYCLLHKKFYLDSEIDGNCKDGEYGENNYSNICKEYYLQLDKQRQRLKNIFKDKD